METIRQASLIYLSPFDWKVSEGDEGATNVEVQVELGQVSAQDTSILYTTVDGGATAGQDYTATSGTLTFPAYTTNLTQTISIPILGDTLDEPNEILTVILSDPTASVIEPETVRIEIIDDDEPITPSSQYWRCRGSENSFPRLAGWRIDFVSAHVDHEPVVLE